MEHIPVKEILVCSNVTSAIHVNDYIDIRGCSKGLQIDMQKIHKALEFDFI